MVHIGLMKAPWLHHLVMRASLGLSSRNPLKCHENRWGYLVLTLFFKLQRKGLHHWNIGTSFRIWSDLLNFKYAPSIVSCITFLKCKENCLTSKILIYQSFCHSFRKLSFFLKMVKHQHRMYCCHLNLHALYSHQCYYWKILHWGSVNSTAAGHEKLAKLFQSLTWKEVSNKCGNLFVSRTKSRIKGGLD